MMNSAKLILLFTSFVGLSLTSHAQDQRPNIVFIIWFIEVNRTKMWQKDTYFKILIAGMVQIISLIRYVQSAFDIFINEIIQCYHYFIIKSYKLLLFLVLSSEYWSHFGPME